MPTTYSLVTNSTPNIVIIGAGAMGSLYAALLSQAGCKVTLVARRPGLAEQINSKGIVIEEDDVATVYPNLQAVADIKDAPAADLLLLFVKGQDTVAAMASAAPYVRPETSILTLQNGLGNVDAIADHVPLEQILAGVSYTGATPLAPARIKIGGRGESILGELNGKMSPRLLAAAQIFERAGLRPKISENIKGVIWLKVLVNAGINPVAALTRLKNGELAAFPESRRLMSVLVAEGAELAEHLGITLEDSDPVAHTMRVALQTGCNTASMLQDILEGRKTEIESINGMLVRKGQEVGLNLPLNRAITLLIRLLEKSQRIC